MKASSNDRDNVIFISSFFALLVFVTIHTVARIVFEGHQKSCVTPYMHVFAYHVPDQIREHGSIRQFSGQGVEKNNDDTKRHYYSSNRHDAARDILLTEARKRYSHLHQTEKGVHKT